MLSSFMFFVAIIILKADALSLENDPVQIVLETSSRKLASGQGFLFCDHNFSDKLINYTVLEGEEFEIIIKHTYFNHFTCNNYYNNTDFYSYARGGSMPVTTLTTFTAEKRMGTMWNCTILVYPDNNPGRLRSVVEYKGVDYSAAYCYMKIHVRPKKSPQTILVNNMVLHAVRTDLSEKDVDFTTEYQYAAGDVVDVTCINFLNESLLMMEYAMAGTISDKSTMADLLAHRAIGLFAKLHSGHDNSYMLCTNSESTDYTKVMVTFVMRTELDNNMRVIINGKTIRPKLKNDLSRQYEIEYKYPFYQFLSVICEVQRTDVNLRVDYYSGLGSYEKTDLIPTKKAEMTFYLKAWARNQILCSSFNVNGTNVEKVVIRFTEETLHWQQAVASIEQYPLHMEISSSGKMMELHSDDELKVIFYEFKDGETLQIKCGPLLARGLGILAFLQFKDSDNCKTFGCTISKTLHVTRKDVNNEIICYLKQRVKPFDLRSEDKVVREIRVILRETVQTTISTDIDSPVIALTTTNAPIDSTSNETSPYTYALVYCLTVAGVSVIIILIILLYWTIKKPSCCIRSSLQELPSVPAPRPHPDTAYYENMLSVFRPINEREAMELENHYEEIE